MRNAIVKLALNPVILANSIVHPVRCVKDVKQQRLKNVNAVSMRTLQQGASETNDNKFLKLTWRGWLFPDAHTGAGVIGKSSRRDSRMTAIKTE